MVRRFGVVLVVLLGCSDTAGTSGAGAAATNGSGDAASSGASTGGGPPSNEPLGGGGVGPPSVDPGPPSHGGTITFQEIGAPGWYPSRRDPSTGPCDAFQSDTCCLAQHDVAGDQLTPWDADLILTLRGPLLVDQLAVYQPGEDGAATWNLVSAWTAADAARPQGIAFHGNGTEDAGFDGTVGTECLVDVSTDLAFGCGPGSVPYCPEGTDGRWGWSGSKLIVMLATTPHAGEVGSPCSDDMTGNWYDAPWVGLSVGELVRSGKFGGCHCYAKNPDEWYLGDGCGQFNVFEVVNDNNQYKNLDVFSTNFFGYAGYVGEGPCGEQCDVSMLDPAADLIDKSSSAEAPGGAVASPSQGPGAAFRRPVGGWRYFVMLLDAPSRTVQLGLVHPAVVPSSVGELLPGLPASVGSSTIDALRELRLPN